MTVGCLRLNQNKLNLTDDQLTFILRVLTLGLRILTVSTISTAELRSTMRDSKNDNLLF